MNFERFLQFKTQSANFIAVKPERATATTQIIAFIYLFITFCESVKCVKIPMFNQSFRSQSKFVSMLLFPDRRRYFLSAVFILLSAFLPAPALFAQDEINQPDAVKLFNQAQDAHEKGDLQTALKFYDEALRASPEFPEAEYQRGTIFISLGRLTEAEKAFRRAIALKDDWALPRTNLGLILVSTNRFAEAEKVLN